MLTSRARLSVGVFSLGVHRLTCEYDQSNAYFSLQASILTGYRARSFITHQKPDAKLTEEALVVLVVLLVIKLDVVQRVVGGRQAHLTTLVHLKLTLLCIDFCLLQKAGTM